MPQHVMPIVGCRRETPPVHRANRLFAIFCTMLACISSHASSRTWYVKPNGSGDTVSIQAAVDSSSAGDSVVAAAGTYYESVVLDKGIVTKSIAKLTIRIRLCYVADELMRTFRYAHWAEGGAIGFIFRTSC